jgi:hypothetical protein
VTGKLEERTTRFGALANRVFLQIEIVAYILLGLLLAVAAMLGIFNAASLLLAAVKEHDDALSDPPQRTTPPIAFNAVEIPAT